MATITWANSNVGIGVDYGLQKDYSATYVKSCDNVSINSTVQANFEEEVKNIRWFWSYKPIPIGLDNISLGRTYTVTIGGMKYPGSIISSSYDKYPKLSSVTPKEYRIPARAELESGFPYLKALTKNWDEIFEIKVIFYEEYYSDGTRKTNFSQPYKFFSEYEPEEEK